MLSNVRFVIFDESSQIEFGDYFPDSDSFLLSPPKTVFIGDDKQCGLDNLFLSLVI